MTASETGAAATGAPAATHAPAPDDTPDRGRVRTVRGPRRGLRLGLVPAVLVVAVVVLAAVAPGLLAPQPPDLIDPVHALAGPGPGHWLGTDQLGRDVLSRIVHGARTSLVIGFGATAFAVVVGSLLGVLAAAAGRAVDQILMRATDILLAFPGLMLSLVVVAVLGPGTVNATLAIGASLLPGFVRLARGQALAIRGSDYVRAAVVMGRSRGSVILRHLLPNALPPLLVLATVNIGSAVISGSTLSFLGLGPQPPSPEWGAMLAEGRDHLDTAWASAVFPGLAITVTVVAVTVVGRALRSRFDGRDTHGR
ncbi:ABC transporter permease subunit [Streptomyces sp. GF20]|uniref:ABC transporter permease n=1 Tax=Streptomyces TaxID=1883 RepID=UPI001020A677|nr:MULTISPECIES: ABC transporter permease [Streptomyces]QHC14348.1 ABC transporter permease subunit [Streptomyces sp. GF20]RZD54724.1 peptide ABC transporter permease [Streptomyces albidoflavus]